MHEAQGVRRLLESPQGAETVIEKLYQATVRNCESGQIAWVQIGLI